MSEAIERLRAFEALDLQHHSDVAELLVERDRYRSLLEGAAKALEPFAEVAGEYAPQEADAFLVWTDFDPLGFLRHLDLGKFRAARDLAATVSDPVAEI